MTDHNGAELESTAPNPLILARSATIVPGPAVPCQRGIPPSPRNSAKSCAAVGYPENPFSLPHRSPSRLFLRWPAILGFRSIPTPCRAGSCRSDFHSLENIARHRCLTYWDDLGPCWDGETVAAALILLGGAASGAHGPRPPEHPHASDYVDPLDPSISMST
jgi:hypothetical protein